jgi:alpha-galactosidase
MKMFEAVIVARSWMTVVLLPGLAWLSSVVSGSEMEPFAPSESLKSLWRVRSPHEFQGALKQEIGFSFTYDGKEVGPARPANWQVATQAGGQQTRFHHPSGLTVIRQARMFAEFEAIEYTLRFKNESRSELPVLAAVNAMDLTFEGDFAKGISVVSCGGGGAEAVFPPKDFAVARTLLGPTVPLKDQVTLAADGGMPSKINLPLFLIENEAKAAGIYIGIGWTGNWKATIRADYRDNTLHVQAGMPDLNLKLQPGEEISCPSILIGGFRGPLSDGINVLRRAIRDGYTPSVGGQKLVAPIVYTTWFDIGAELDEKLFRTLVDRAAEIGQEIFLLDAGWYAGTPTAPYTDMRTTWEAISRSLGNWEQGEDRTRFPSGLRPLADYVRSKGMQFGLWFEPERVGPESLLAKRRPDWITYIPKRKWGLVDFGNPEVQDYFCKIFDRYIKDLGVRYVRWDNNSEVPSSYWAARDAPDRRGISEIRHLEGVHRVEDYIRKNHPDVILESCAGGGQRIDLATLQRRHTIWISDQTMDPQIVRFHLEGLNHFIPGNRQGVAFAAMRNALRQPGVAFPDIAYQCRFGGAFGLAGRLHEWPQAMKDQARKHFDVFKKIRRFLAEDYYLLGPQSRTLETWSGWQFHDPKMNEGFVQAFRIRSSEQTRKLVLKGLDPKSDYQFTDSYTGNTFKGAGAKLISEGLEFDLPPISSRVLIYRRSP